MNKEDVLLHNRNIFIQLLIFKFISHYLFYHCIFYPLADYTRIFTSNSGTVQNYANHKLQVIRANWMSFKVKACSDAHILLFNSQVR